MTTALEQGREDAALGAAWRRCEAALPEGWLFVGLLAGFASGWIAAEPNARAADPRQRRMTEIWGAERTPLAALEALADALEARKAAE